MKNLRWQILIVIAALVAIAVILFGQKDPGIETILEPEAVSGGVYTEALIGSPGRLNPLLDAYNQVDRDVNRLLFGRLIKFDDWGNPIPDLAEAWGVSVSGDVFNITLRDGLTWHDGEALTTADVAFTIEQMKNPDNPIPEDIQRLWASVEVIVFDERNIQIRLQEAYAPFVDYLSFEIVPKHLLEGLSGETLIADTFNFQPIGSGPYKFEGLLSENRIIVGVVLTANEDYYAGRPLIDQIVLKYFPDNASALLAYQNGEVTGISNIDQQDLSALIDIPTLNAYTSRLPEMGILAFNLENEDILFIQDSSVRKAFYYAINRPWILSEALGGQAVKAEGPILQNSWAYYDAVEKYDFNPSTAVQLLREAGYVIPAEGGSVREKEGIQLQFELVYLDDPIHTRIAVMISEYLSAVGVRVQLIGVNAEELLTSYLEPRNYQAALIDLSLLDTPDPDPYPFWHQSQMANGQNYSMWNDRRASEYLEKARVSIERSDRERLYRNFQVHFSRELPALPLYYTVYTYFVDQEVEGINFGSLYDPSDRFDNVSEWYLLTKLDVQEPQGTPNN